MKFIWLYEKKREYESVWEWKICIKPFQRWLISNLFIMDKTKEQLEKLREVAEASLTKTDELQKVLAQIEALMSREESQTLSKKK